MSATGAGARQLHNGRRFKVLESWKIGFEHRSRYATYSEVLFTHAPVSPPRQVRETFDGCFGVAAFGCRIFHSESTESAVDFGEKHLWNRGGCKSM